MKVRGWPGRPVRFFTASDSQRTFLELTAVGSAEAMAVLDAGFLFYSRALCELLYYNSFRNGYALTFTQVSHFCVLTQTKYIYICIICIYRPWQKIARLTACL